MSASPVALSSASISTRSYSRRPPLALTQRRLEANRRNAARSTGPRTAAGKARVARNPIKHGFFAEPERWTERQQRDFAETFEGLCDDFKPQTEMEEICVATIADSYVRMAGILRYENIAALKYHRECERELDARIAAATPAEAARLEAHRKKLRRAGLWRPTIPGPREAAAIIRYQGRLHRAIRDATADLAGFKSARSAVRPHQKVAKRRETTSSGVLSRCGEGPRMPHTRSLKAQKQTHFIQQNRGISPSTYPAASLIKERGDTTSSSLPNSTARRTSNPAFDSIETAKTNPLNPMFTGNRHERRKAKALLTHRR